MNLRMILLISGLVVGLLLAGAAALFWIQNASRTAMVSLNLGFTQLQLVEPMPVPALMALCLGVGLVAGVAIVVPLWARAGSRARKAERSAVLGHDTSSGY